MNIKIINSLFKKFDILLLTGEHNIGKTLFFDNTNIFDIKINFSSDLSISSFSRKNILIEELSKYENKKIIIDNFAYGLHKNQNITLIQDCNYICKENNLLLLFITNSLISINTLDFNSILFLIKFKDQKILLNSIEHSELYNHFISKNKENYYFFESSYWLNKNEKNIALLNI